MPITPLGGSHGGCSEAATRGDPALSAANDAFGAPRKRGCEGRRWKRRGPRKRAATLRRALRRGEAPHEGPCRGTARGCWRPLAFLRGALWPFFEGPCTAGSLWARAGPREALLPRRPSKTAEAPRIRPKRNVAPSTAPRPCDKLAQTPLAAKALSAKAVCRRRWRASAASPKCPSATS
jgi:hypothetical protein